MHELGLEGVRLGEAENRRKGHPREKDQHA